MRRLPIAAVFSRHSKPPTPPFRPYGHREVANALAMADRRQRITREGIADFLETLRRLPIEVERREALWLWQAVLPLAREYRLSAYDAAYLELAKRDGVHLATLDHDLQEACHTLGIPIFETS